MKLRTNCGAYQCKHGAPYRNAVPTTPGVEQLQQQRPAENDSILTTIDYILNRRRPQLKYYDGVLIVAALFGRTLFPVQAIVGTGVGWLFTVTTGALTSGFVTFAVMAYTSFLMFHGLRQQLRRRTARRDYYFHGDGGGGGDMTASEFLLGTEARNQRDRQRNLMQMSEQQMLAEALRRSLREQ